MIFIAITKFCANETDRSRFPGAKWVRWLGWSPPHELRTTSRISITQARGKLDFSKSPSAAREVNVNLLRYVA